ncbi:MAG: tetratricopeptide repeat protein [Candidatus Lokiarchaeota archaeon]|nr:tetratricopeptide repeat protein [Candidatus Lokiarchaeota archaeon]
MVYFEIKNVGFNCDKDKDACPEYPDSCEKCVLERLKSLGFKFDSHIKVMEMDSEEKRLEMYQEQIWQKFLNILNIKHIIIMDKNSGVPITNYAVSEAGIDAGMLSGFIQANITFSERSGSTDQQDSVIDYHFYHFQYKDFNILLKNGEFSRVCLILDHKPSKTLESITREFVIDLEKKYASEFKSFQTRKILNFPFLEEFIIEGFSVQFLFPMILTHTIPPDAMESINDNKIKNAVFKLAKEFLSKKHFFFINTLLSEIKKIIDVESKIIIYEIYQLLKMSVMIPTTIETVESSVKEFEEKRARKIANSHVISHIISTENSITALDELKKAAKTMDQDTARKQMEQFIKKGKTAERSKIYKEAQKEYEKALYLATGFNFNDDIGKISFMILELDKIIGDIELEYAINAGETAERKKDFIDSIRHYKKAIAILEKDVGSGSSESKIKKLEKKISKLQDLI